MTAERLRRTERGERSCETAKFSLLLCKIRSEAWNRTNGRRSPNWGNSALSTNSPAHSPPATGTTLRGVGDDAAVIAASRSEATLVSTDLLMEGIDFDLTYFPLKHLGYKTVTVGASDILAMNALPEQLLLSLGVSSKFSVEALQEFYEGVRLACEELNIDLAGGDTTASVTGLTVNVTAIGRARRSDIVYRNGAKPNDLICITGNLAPPIWVSNCSNARSASCTTSKIPNRSSPATNTCSKNT